jgi:glucose-1-phosphate adenylyltransferase
MHDVLGFILGGGRGAGLFPLTQLRSTPAVPIAGMYRLIDIPVSNCINSGVRRIYVLTQFLSVSLHRHIANTYKFAPFRQGFVEPLAAQQTNEAADWYKGTADALRQNLRYLQSDPARDFLILSADGLYRMNFTDLIRTHRDSKADITVAVSPVRRNQVAGLGIVRLDEHHRILELVEKPRLQDQLDALRAPASWLKKQGFSGSDKEYLANMGIYLCRREVLLDLLQSQPEAVDLVTQHFARIVGSHHLQAHLFDDYWQDLGGSIRAYHEANLALAGEQPPFDFHIPDGVIYTRMRNLPASRVCASHLDHALISEGCVIEEGASLERCVIGQRMRIGKGVVMKETILTGADRIESESQRQENRQQRIPDIGVGDGSTLIRAIIDKDARIGRNVKIVNKEEVREADGPNYYIRDGIVVIPKRAVVSDGTVI